MILTFRKHGQMQIAENVAVIVIFFFLLVLGLVFYLRVHTSNVAIKQSEYNDLLAVQVSQKVAFMPELRCSKDNVVEPNCFNLEQVKIFGDTLPATRIITPDDRDNYYYPQFRNSKVTIQQLYPVLSTPSTITLYDKSIAKFKSKISTKVYVSLFDPSQKKYTLGEMTVDVYT